MPDFKPTKRTTSTIPISTERLLPVILVMTQDEALRQLISQAVGKIGCGIHTVANSTEIFVTYEKLQPAVILLDTAVNGVAVSQTFIQHYGTDCPPIILIGAADDGVIQTALAVGVYDCFRPPLQPQLFTHRLARLLQQEQTQRRTEQRNSVLETLHLVTKSANSTLSVNEILENVVYLTGHAMQADLAFICNVNLAENTTQVLSDYRAPHLEDLPPSDRGSIYSISEQFPKILDWLSNKPEYVVVQMSELDLSLFEELHYGAYGVQTAVLVRLKAKDKLLGYLEYWYQKPRRLHSYEGNMLVSVASQVAMILNNAYLHAQAQQYLAELEERNRELDAYAHTIAHDLKNPLHLMVNYADIARMDVAEIASSETVEYLGRVVKAGLRMSTMIEDLLRLSQLRDAAAEAVRVDVSAVVGHATARFEDLIGERRVMVIVQPNLPTCLGHAPWMEEIFANLINNALKYLGEENSAPLIHIRGYAVDKMIRYDVQDNGIGIEPEDQARLFQLFSRLKNVGKVKGFGVGLSIVHRLVIKQQGEVGVESRPGMGSTFWFKLPAP